MKDRKRWEYAFYKGDELLAQGTIDEICEQLHLDRKTFWFYRTKTYQNNYKGKPERKRIIIRTDIDEDDLH